MCAVDVILTTTVEDRAVVEQVEGGIEHSVAGAEIVGSPGKRTQRDEMLTEFEGS